MINLPTIISNKMILQRDSENKIWGRATVGQMMKIRFLGQDYCTYPDAEGKFQIVLKPAKAGGPYTIELYSGSDRLTISDVYVGDVWLLGGQSNMELPLERVEERFAEEIKQIDYEDIHVFIVPKEYDFHGPRENLNGGEWQKLQGEAVKKVSAAGFFMAAKLYKSLRIPIGLISTAIGGTPAEAWTSEETLHSFGRYEAELECDKDDSYVKGVLAKDAEMVSSWWKTLNEKDQGLKKDSFYPAYRDASSWDTIQIPVNMANTDRKDFRGSMWFRKEIDLPERLFPILDKECILRLGTIEDADRAYINGTQVGNTEYRYPPRIYRFSSDILRPGKNIITLRVIGDMNPIRLIEEKPYFIKAGGYTVDLKGEWQVKIGADMPRRGAMTFFEYKCSGAYNAMLCPLKNYQIKAAAFYQGESNGGNGKVYGPLFRAMIADWRRLFQNAELPFIYVQIANYGDHIGDEEYCEWAVLREAQRRTLSVNNTAMVVSADVGEWNDLHPLDKKTVGERIALAAERLVYRKPITASGPNYISKKILGNEIEIHFSDVCGGLVCRTETLDGFSIRGNGKFVKAEAKIVEDTVVVSSLGVPKPMEVRYAWADSPKPLSLYNKEGFPASPFTTEEI